MQALITDYSAKLTSEANKKQETKTVLFKTDLNIKLRETIPQGEGRDPKLRQALKLKFSGGWKSKANLSSKKRKKGGGTQNISDIRKFMVEGPSTKNEIFKQKIPIEKRKFVGNGKFLVQQHGVKGEKHGKESPRGFGQPD